MNDSKNTENEKIEENDQNLNIEEVKKKDNSEDNKENNNDFKGISDDELNRLRNQARGVEIRIRRPNPFKTIIIYLVILLLAFFMLDYFSGATSKDMSYTELIKNIEEENVSSIIVQNDRYTAKVLLKDDKETVRYVKFVAPGSFMDYIQPYLNQYNIELNVAEPTFFEVIEPMLPNLLLLGGTLAIFVYMLKRTGQGNDKALSFGKNRARMYDGSGKDKVTFENVAGLSEEKEEVKELVDFLKNPKKYRDIGARIPKGMLFVGGPGTGKTLLAKAIAGEAGVPFFTISGSDFVEMFVGVGASRVRDLFAEAKAHSPCIIFIDEIDAVGRQRGAGLGGGHDEREQTLNQLLVEMDGFATHENVIVIAATNRPDILDKALLRPGRFDRQIVVHDPDIGAREEILKLHAKNKPFAGGVDFKIIAKNTAGFSGADLENMVNEAALLTARKNKKLITMEDVEEAMVRVMMGPEKRSKVISEKEKKLTAYHEAGHAVVSRFLPTHDAVHQISIIPRGMAGGYTMYKPNEDKSYNSKSEMQEHIVSLLGGRVAEQLVLDDISTGASNDIERATKIARGMVMKYGMSDKLGPVTYETSSQEEVFLGRDFNNQRNYSEKVASEIDEEVRSIIDNAYRYAERLLKDNIDKLHKVASVLLEKEKIDSKEFDAIFEGKEE